MGPTRTRNRRANGSVVRRDRFSPASRIPISGAVVKRHRPGVYARIGGLERVAELFVHDMRRGLFVVSVPGEDGALALSCSGDAQWQPARLPECAICLDARADAMPECGCRCPRVCARCAPSLDSCPVCRGPTPSRGARVIALPRLPTGPLVPLDVTRGNGDRATEVWVGRRWSIHDVKFALHVAIGTMPDAMRLSRAGHPFRALHDGTRVLEACGTGARLAPLRLM